MPEGRETRGIASRLSLLDRYHGAAFAAVIGPLVEVPRPYRSRQRLALDWGAVFPRRSIAEPATAIRTGKFDSRSGCAS
jgi:hypothetical protein